MVKCQGCGSTVKRAQRVVVATRPKTYEPRWRDKVCLDKGGQGTEIVREKTLCSSCVGGSAA